MLKLCIDNAALVVKFNKAILVNKGQGDGLTKWKGWSWKLLLIKLVIMKILYFFIQQVNLGVRTLFASILSLFLITTV